MYEKISRTRIPVNVTYIDGSNKTFDICTEKKDPNDIVKDIMITTGPKNVHMITFTAFGQLCKYIVNEVEDSMKTEPKIYHTRFSDFILSRISGKYLNFKNFWGSIVTNKLTRTEDRYAVIFSPDGSKINYIDHDTFGMFRNKYSHEYIGLINDNYFNEHLLNNISKLTDRQAKVLLNSIKENFPDI